MSLSAHDARLLALNAAGFGQELTSFDEVIRTTSLIQLDSVNVFQRAHLMPAFSRIGAYSQEDFESWAFGSARSRGVEELGPLRSANSTRGLAVVPVQKG